MAWNHQLERINRDSQLKVCGSWHILGSTTSRQEFLARKEGPVPGHLWSNGINDVRIPTLPSVLASEWHLSWPWVMKRTSKDHTCFIFHTYLDLPKGAEWMMFGVPIHHPLDPNRTPWKMLVYYTNPGKWTGGTHQKWWKVDGKWWCSFSIECFWGGLAFNFQGCMLKREIHISGAPCSSSILCPALQRNGQTIFPVQSKGSDDTKLTQPNTPKIATPRVPSNLSHLSPNIKRNLLFKPCSFAKVCWIMFVVSSPTKVPIAEWSLSPKSMYVLSQFLHNKKWTPPIKPTLRRVDASGQKKRSCSLSNFRPMSDKHIKFRSCMFLLSKYESPPPKKKVERFVTVGWVRLHVCHNFSTSSRVSIEDVHQEEV